MNAYFAESRILRELENNKAADPKHMANWIAWLLRLIGTAK